MSTGSLPPRPPNPGPARPRTARVTAALPLSLVLTKGVVAGVATSLVSGATALAGGIPLGPIRRVATSDAGRGSKTASARTGMLDFRNRARTLASAATDSASCGDRMTADPQATHPSDASATSKSVREGASAESPPSSDEALLVRSREGDRAAFQTLVERYRSDLLRFLYRFLGSRAAADDVFQETFLQVHLAADTFDAERRFRPWLFAIAANKARDHHRRQRRRTMSSLSASVGDGDAALVDLLEMDAPSPSAPAESTELQGSVKQVVDELPNHYREILLLAYFQKMSYQQIAECLSIPLGTVKSRLHAAVASFATTWKNAHDQSEE